MATMVVMVPNCKSLLRQCKQTHLFLSARSLSIFLKFLDLLNCAASWFFFDLNNGVESAAEAIASSRLSSRGVGVVKKPMLELEATLPLRSSLRSEERRWGKDRCRACRRHRRKGAGKGTACGSAT